MIKSEALRRTVHVIDPSMEAKGSTQKGFGVKSEGKGAL
jgi:hypothetical protein